MKGVGALAGPVVAAAVLIGPNQSLAKLEGLDDSKKITRARREAVYEAMMHLDDFVWTTVAIDAAKVDELNVLDARLMAMAEAVQKLQPKPSLVFVDGNLLLPGVHPHIQKAIVGADATNSIVAAASVIAKVTRDRIMIQHANQWPLYGFERHVGYATRNHLQSLRLHGPCPVHRLTYKPVQQCLRSQAEDNG